MVDVAELKRLLQDEEVGTFEISFENDYIPLTDYAMVTVTITDPDELLDYYGWDDPANIPMDDEHDAANGLYNLIENKVQSESGDLDGYMGLSFEFAN